MFKNSHKINNLARASKLAIITKGEENEWYSGFKVCEQSGTGTVKTKNNE